MKGLNESFPISQQKVTSKNIVCLILSLKFCSRALGPTSYYYGEIKDEFVCFKLKKIYFIIIFFPLKAFFDTANTNK